MKQIEPEFSANNYLACERKNNKYVENNITDYKDSSKLWKKVLKIKRRYNPPERPL